MYCSDITGLIGLRQSWDWSASALTTRVKWTVSQYFCLRFFSWITYPPSPWNNIRVISIFLQKFAEIFASQGASLVSTTPVANFAIRTAGVFDTGGKLLSKCFRYLAFCFLKTEGARNASHFPIIFCSFPAFSWVRFVQIRGRLLKKCKPSTQEFV